MISIFKICRLGSIVSPNSFALRKDIPLAIKSQMKSVLLEMSQDKEGRAVLKEFGAKEFIETTEKDYQPVFDIAKKAGIDLVKYNYLND